MVTMLDWVKILEISDLGPKIKFKHYFFLKICYFYRNSAFKNQNDGSEPEILINQQSACIQDRCKFSMSILTFNVYTILNVYVFSMSKNPEVLIMCIVQCMWSQIPLLEMLGTRHVLYMLQMFNSYVFERSVNSNELFLIMGNPSENLKLKIRNTGKQGC